MCKKATYHCERPGCKFHKTVEKGRSPISLNTYPREHFKTVKIGKQKHHYCKDCAKQLQNQIEHTKTQFHKGVTTA